VPEWVEKVITVLGSVLAGLLAGGFAVWTARANLPPKMMTAKALLVKAEADADASAMAGWEALSKRMEGHVLRLEGAVNSLEQHVYSLEGVLRDNGIPVPQRPAPQPWVLFDSGIAPKGPPQ
jgi:hypothetical protein